MYAKLRVQSERDCAACPAAVEVLQASGLAHSLFQKRSQSQWSKCHILAQQLSEVLRASASACSAHGGSFRLLVRLQPVLAPSLTAPIATQDVRPPLPSGPTHGTQRRIETLPCTVRLAVAEHCCPKPSSSRTAERQAQRERYRPSGELATFFVRAFSTVFKHGAA